MRKVLKWTGFGIAGLLIVLLAAVGTLYVLGGARLEAPLQIADESLAVAADSATIAHGAYLVATHACRECHAADLGGAVFVDAPPFRATATNLTSGEGGIGGTYTDADWERAIRHGVRPNGQPLAAMMPSALFNNLSDDELTAMVAYLKTITPIDRTLPATEFRPLGRVIAGTGAKLTASAAVDHERAHPAAAPPVGATVEYGRYRTTTICTYCHGANLEGGPPVEPGTPPAPPLASVKGWTLEQFTTTMRTGVTPAGRELNPVIMPWPAFQHMNDTEIEALYRYLQTLPDPTETVAMR